MMNNSPADSASSPYPNRQTPRVRETGAATTDGSVPNMLEQIDGSIASNAAAIKRWEELPVRELSVLCVLGVIANIYFLANFSLSIDDELAAIRGDPAIWISQGRWTAYLVEKFLFQQPAVPFVPFIVLVICLAISGALMTRMHGFVTSYKTYAAYGVFVSFPTWWFISEFYANVPSVAIGFLLVCASLSLTFAETTSGHKQVPKHRFRAPNWTAVVMLAVAIGAYQSFLLLYICMSAGVLLARSRQARASSHIVYRQTVDALLRLGLVVLTAGVIYGFINHVGKWVVAMPSPYMDKFINLANLHHPIWLVYAVGRQAVKVYTGSAAIYGAAMPVAGVLLLLSGVSIVVDASKRVVLNAVLWLVVLASPFALNVLAGGQGMPLRSMVALPYVAWLMLLLVLTRRQTLLVATGWIVLATYQLQILAVTSQYAASMQLTQAQDRMLAADIYRRIGEQTAEFDRNSTVLIDVYGHKGVKTVYAHGWSSAMNLSFFDINRGNLDRMVAYMSVLGYENLKAASESDRRMLTPIFAEMPSWPASGCVRKVGKIHLVKLSSDPDPIHAAALESSHSPPLRPEAPVR